MSKSPAPAYCGAPPAAALLRALLRDGGSADDGVEREMGHHSPTMTACYSEFADAERRWAFARADVTRGLDLPRARAH